MTSRRAYTLIEILIVLALLSLVLCIAVPSLGILNSVKEKQEFNELKKLNRNVLDVNKNQQEFGELQRDQNNALLAILRNDLYQSFKIHRHHKVWTDDECMVQTKLHHAYRALHGNGEEELWWEKKRGWTIVSEEEFRKIVGLPSANN